VADPVGSAVVLRHPPPGTLIWTDEDRRILRQRATRAAEQMPDMRAEMKVYFDYIDSLNL
jgi:hypothetical protein